LQGFKPAALVRWLRLAFLFGRNRLVNINRHRSPPTLSHRERRSLPFTSTSRKACDQAKCQPGTIEGSDLLLPRARRTIFERIAARANPACPR
jgi:hypothetical protein